MRPPPMDARFISGKLCSQAAAVSNRQLPVPLGAKRRGSIGMIRLSLICGPD